jgi:hypothetical protein
MPGPPESIQMPGKKIVRGQNVQDLWSWAVDTREIAILTYKAEISAGRRLYQLEPIRLLLLTSGDLMITRARNEMGRWPFRQISESATPVPDADTIIEETRARSDELGRGGPSWQDTKEYLLLASRQARAACARLHQLTAPERVEYARSPWIFIKEVIEADYRHYAAALLLERCLDVMDIIEKQDEPVDGNNPKR